MILAQMIRGDGLFSGYSFREKIEPDSQGTIGILQMKDILKDYSGFDFNNLDKVSDFVFKDKFYLKKGDVLFVSKGTNNYAISIDLVDMRIVPSATFFVIRVDEKIILSDYLVWYMNQVYAQSYFTEKKAGTYVPNLKKQDILGLPIILPSLEKQNAIARTSKLINREIILLDKIKEYRKELIQTQLLKIINND